MKEERRGEIDVTVLKISVYATETQQSISSVTTLRYSNLANKYMHREQQ